MRRRKCVLILNYQISLFTKYSASSSLPNCDFHHVGGFAVRSQNHINLTPAGEAARQQRVELIQSDHLSLRPGKVEWRVFAADAHRHCAETTAIAESRAEADQEDLVAFRAKINRNGDELLLRFV